MIRGTIYMAVVAAVLSSAPDRGMAATLDLFVQGAVAMGGSNAPPEHFDTFLFTSDGIEASATSGAERAQAAGPFGSGTSGVSYSVDPTRGQMRLSVDAAATAVPDGRGGAYSYVYMALSESFLVAGTGRVTVGMEIDAFWDGESNRIVACSNHRGFGFVTANTSCGTYGSDIMGPGAGSITGELLEVAFDIDSPGGVLVDFFWTLQGQADIQGGRFPSATTFLDASNTANLFIRTEGAVTATPQSAGFLSDPAFGSGPVVPAVPLPASALLLLGGLGGLTVLRRGVRRHA